MVPLSIHDCVIEPNHDRDVRQENDCVSPRSNGQGIQIFSNKKHEDHNQTVDAGCFQRCYASRHKIIFDASTPAGMILIFFGGFFLLAHDCDEGQTSGRYDSIDPRGTLTSTQVQTAVAMADSLVASAFGASACLYADVLQCDCTATTSELRKAYHRRALLFHPDKQSGGGDNANNKATLCFQAVSAAYEILMDSGRRAFYDATGHLDDGSHSVSGNKNDDEWTAFFESVFREVITVGHNDATYRGSDREASDVLKFYRLCKGDLDKILSCVVCGKLQDKPRWARDIIGPAILSGQVERYSAFDQTSGMKDHDSLIDTDDDKDVKKRKRKCKRSRDEEKVDELLDTDDEAVCSKKGSTTKIHQSIGKASTSKRDKIEYRVARKQKEKKEKQVEFCKLVKEKQWGGGARIGKPSRPGTFSNDLLLSLECKYSAGNDDTRRRKMAKKKKTKKKHREHFI